MSLLEEIMASKSTTVDGAKALQLLKEVQGNGGYAIGINPTINGNIGDKLSVISSGEFVVRSGKSFKDGKDWASVQLRTNRGFMDCDITLLESPRTSKGGEIPCEIVENKYISKKTGKEVIAKKLAHLL